MRLNAHEEARANGWLKSFYGLSDYGVWPRVEVYSAPWWFRLAMRWFPDRCREVPEAVNPDRIVMRQFALIRRHLYLQNFSSSEDARFMHSHQWRWTVALGLWGGYIERRLGGNWRKCRRAPYFYVMGHDVIHHVTNPSPGHTSLFLGIGPIHGVPKEYFRTGSGVAWTEHIMRKVKEV